MSTIRPSGPPATVLASTPARHRGHRGLLLAAVATLALAACAGSSADTAGAAGDGGVAEPLPVDSGAEPVTSAMCAQDEPDCEDTIDSGSAAGGAAGSCPVGDADCTDESFSGQDVTRPVPLSSEPLAGDQATVAATSGASATALVGAHLLDETTLQIAYGSDPCTIVEAVEVMESPDEVRVLLLTGYEPGVDACIEPYVEFTTTVELDAPFGDRVLLDLAG